MLVCVDMYDGTVDAEPIKQVNPENILKAFKEIFKRKYLNYPVFITFDNIVSDTIVFSGLMK
jgi:hypothetical protein